MNRFENDQNASHKTSFVSLVTFTLFAACLSLYAEPLNLPAGSLQETKWAISSQTSLLPAIKPQKQSEKSKGKLAQQSKREVFELTDKKEIQKLLADPNVTLYMANSVNNNGIATGQVDPVLQKWAAENYPMLVIPTTPKEENIASR